MERKGIVVGGLGNLLMTDEGVGIHVIRELMKRPALSNNVDFVDLDSSLMGMVHAIAGRQKAILVDCARMGDPAGTIRRFTPDDVSSVKILSRFSLHEGDLLNGLELSRRLGECPKEVVIFGIQPESVAPGEGLSPSLQQRLESYVQSILQELNV
jgi:hydrogenase maturation protease